MPEIPEHLADWLEKQDERCNYCIYDSRSTIRGVHGGPNGPIYPFCYDVEPEKYIDLAALEEAYKEDMADA